MDMWHQQLFYIADVLQRRRRTCCNSTNGVCFSETSRLSCSAGRERKVTPSSVIPESIKLFSINSKSKTVSHG